VSQFQITDKHYLRPLSMVLTSGPREILAMKPAAACCRHRRVIARTADKIKDAASSPVNEEDVMLKKTQLRGKNRLFLELVVANPIVASDHDPPLCSRLREPHDVLSGLRKELVVHAYVEPSGAKGLRHLLTPERAIDEEYEGLRRLSPAGARSGPLPRC
jgi:hypothetical protein